MADATRERPEITNNDGLIEFLQESLEDRRTDSKFFKKTILVLFLIVAILIGGLIGISIYHQNTIRKMAKESEERMYKFLSEYDFETEIMLDTNHIIDSDKAGNIFFAR